MIFNIIGLVGCVAFVAVQKVKLVAERREHEKQEAAKLEARKAVRQVDPRAN